MGRSAGLHWGEGWGEQWVDGRGIDGESNGFTVEGSMGGRQQSRAAAVKLGLRSAILRMQWRIKSDERVENIVFHPLVK